MAEAIAMTVAVRNPTNIEEARLKRMRAPKTTMIISFRKIKGTHKVPFIIAISDGKCLICEKKRYRDCSLYLLAEKLHMEGCKNDYTSFHYKACLIREKKKEPKLFPYTKRNRR